MDPIKPLDHLTALLRQRLASESTARAPARKTSHSSAASGAQRPSTEALRGRVGKAIGAIDAHDPARRSKIARAFVENVLCWQFGDELINDPGFAVLVEEVQSTFEREPGMVEALAETDLGRE